MCRLLLNGIIRFSQIFLFFFCIFNFGIKIFLDKNQSKILPRIVLKIWNLSHHCWVISRGRKEEDFEGFLFKVWPWIEKNEENHLFFFLGKQMKKEKQRIDIKNNATFSLLKITPDNVSSSDVSRRLSRLKQSEEAD